MSNSQQIRTVSVEAGSTVPLYRFVVQAAGDGQYDLVGVAQARMDGISASAAGADEAMAMVIPDGSIAKVEAGAVVARDAQIGSDNVGRAITAVSGVGNYRAGRALDAAGGAGEIIRIQFLVDEDQVA